MFGPGKFFQASLILVCNAHKIIYLSLNQNKLECLSLESFFQASLILVCKAHKIIYLSLSVSKNKLECLSLASF